MVESRMSCISLRCATVSDHNCIIDQTIAHRLLRACAKHTKHMTQGQVACLIELMYTLL
jgi:hypothetical protein